MIVSRVDTLARRVADLEAENQSLRGRAKRALAIRPDLERLIGWAKSGKGTEDYSMDIGDVDRMADDILDIIRRSLTAEPALSPTDTTGGAE